MSLRILLATHAPAHSSKAVYRSTTRRADHLRRQGHHVDVLTPESLFESRWSRFDPLILPAALALRGLASYDIVVFHSYLGWAFHALRWWLDPGRRVATVTSFHGLEPLYHRAVGEELRRAGRVVSLRFRVLHHVMLPRVLKASCRASDAVFCLNSLEVRYLASQAWADDGRIYRVVNGVEPECFDRRRIDAGARRLLFVGQWLPGKGVRYLAEAFSTLCATRDLELSCVGTGSPPEVVLSDFPSEVRHRVTVVPVVDRAGIYEALTRADIFVFPSLSEGFSNALLEAMAAGLPVVATPVGAAVDLLQPDRNAVVVAPGDSVAFAGGIERLIEDRRLREELAAAARHTATHFTIDAADAGFEACLLDVVRRHALEYSPSPVRDGDAVS